MSIRINDKIGINPVVYGELKQSEFIKLFKGKTTDTRLKEIYTECKKSVKSKDKSKEETKEE